MMSYCRWSSSNFNCDLYCYADCAGGYTTHIAGCRWRLWHRIYAWVVDRRIDLGDCKIRMPRKSYINLIWRLPHWLTHKKIRLPGAGETFNDVTLETFRDRIKRLVGLGYKVPWYVLKNIEEEIEGKSDPPDVL